jgi:type I restriction enzyme, S subunit
MTSTRDVARIQPPEAGWRVAALGEIVERHVERCEDPLKSGFEAIVGVDDLDSNDLRLRRHGRIGIEALPPTFRFVFRSGMVLFPTRRPSLRKCALAPFDGITGEKVLVLKSRDPFVVDPDFLPFLLTSEPLRQWAIGKAIGSVTPHFRWGDLAEFPCPLPPLTEQKRIVAVMAAIQDALDAATHLVGEAKRTYTATVDSIADRAVRTGHMLPLDELIEDGRPITYGILKPGTGFPGGIPVIKVRDYPDGKILDGDLLLTDPAIDQEYRRSRLKTGDLLISIRGTIGRIAFVPDHLHGANITQDTARLSIKSSINSRFVRAMLGASISKAQIRANTTGLAVQGINLGALRRIRVPLPARPDQDRYADILEAARLGITAAIDRRSGHDELRVATWPRLMGGI